MHIELDFLFHQLILQNYGIFIDGSVNPIAYALLKFNGHDRFDRREGEYFNYVQPEQHHSNTPKDGINCYSFALYPEDHQPSGACNFTKITYPKLNLIVNPQIFRYKLSDVDPSITPENDEVLDTDANMSIYSVKYQVLRIISGMAGFAYA